MQLIPARSARLFFLLSAVSLFTGTLPSACAQDSLFDEPAAGDSLAGDDTALTPQQQAQETFKKAMEESDQLMEQKNWGAAAEVLSRVAAFREPQALMKQGICYKNLGANELAINAFSSAYAQLSNPSTQSTYPGLLENALLERGKLFLENGRAREAADDFGQVRATNPTSAEANFQIGKAQLRKVMMSLMSGGNDQATQAELHSAAKSLEQAINLDSNMGEAYLERGRVLSRLRMIDLAVTDLEQASRLMGANSDAGADLGVALSSRAQQETYKVKPDLDRVVADLRHSIETLDGFLKSAPLGKKRLPWETVDLLKPQVEKMLLSKLDAQILLAAEVSSSETDAIYRSVIADADRLLAADVGDEDKARAYYLKGVALRMSNDLAGAIDALTQAIQVYQIGGLSYPEAYLRRGICYYYQNQRDLAIQDFQSAASTPGSFSYDPRAMFWLGMIHAEQGELQTAIREYTRAIAASPRYTPAHLNRGLAYMNMGRYEQALEDFDHVLRSDPNNTDALRYRDLASARR